MHDLSSHNSGFNAHDGLGALTLHHPYYFGNTVFGNVESVDKDFIFGRKAHRVVYKELGKLRDAGVDHRAILAELS